MIRRSSLRISMTVCLLATVGCTANVSVETQPDPAAVGQPVEVSVRVDNPLECPLTDAFVILAVVSENAPITADNDLAVTSGFLGGEDGLDLFCEILNDPTLALCEALVDGGLNGEVPPDVPDFCCEDMVFAENNPELCETAQASTPSVDGVRDAIVERARSLGLPVDEILAARAQATTSGMATQCTLLFEEEFGAFFECALGDIPAGGSATAVGTFTPTIPGRYYSLVFVEGDSACANGNLPGGTACGISAVTASTMAPAASPGGLVALTLGLIAVGAVAIRLRRRIPR